MKLNRRQFILKLFLGTISFLVLDSFWLETYFIEWTEHDISESGPKKIKAIHLTDLHLRSIKSVHASIAKRINEEQPDVIFFTGDSVERNKYLTVLQDFLSLIDIKIPKVTILGNKESSDRVDLQKLRKVYANHNGILLINEAYLLKINNRKINIIGLDDYVHGEPDFLKATEGVNKSLTTVVLNHCPVYREEIDRLSLPLNIKPDLILAGHTHGGQITFFGEPFFTPFGSGIYVKGWYNNEISKMYVSKGVGTTKLPIRFGAMAEASIFYI
ncbi:metallophosphoesterase [Arenibacter sp. BSSL-BM3]|uniref:Metallophosphoesterase n=1 Tax=Arenibacter arenosicollis TaxID=2762274 RepID=A0ABR7QLC1_9FLAO|nr:metallophosphoesterase [Arenibacter arenosicollis]MBC8767909.1 metallophosphoesterase [Arenibacter arenosicollis]